MIVSDDESLDRATLEQLPGLLWRTNRALEPCWVSADLSADQLLGPAGQESDSRRAHREALEGRTACFGFDYGGRHLDAQVAPLRDAAGAIVGVIGMASHGAPGRAERNRRHARGAMRVLAALIGGIAHDVNNALTIIKSYNQFLLESLDPQSESWEDADVIHQAVVRSGRQVAALAAFSRKQLENALQPGLSAVVQGIEPVLPRFVGKNVQVELSLEPNLPPVSMSREQLEQVIMDFAAVAREAMPHGGSLSIATATERLPSPRYERLSHLPDGRYASLQLISSAAPGRRTSLYPPDSGEVDSVVLMARDAAAYIEQVARDHGGGALIEEREDGRTVAVLLPGTA